MRGECVYLQVMVQLFLKGWNSHELADRTGISYPTLRRKLRGAAPMQLEEARRIQTALGCGLTLDQLFEPRESGYDR